MVSIQGFISKIKSMIRELQNGRAVKILFVVLLVISCGVLITMEQYIAVGVLLIMLLSALIVFKVNSTDFFIVIFTVGIPFSYSYTLITARKPAVGPAWPRMIRDAFLLLLVANITWQGIRRNTISFWRKKRILPLALWLIYTLGLAILSLDLSLITLWVGVKYYLLFPMLGLLIPAILDDRAILRYLLNLFFGVAIFIAIFGILQTLLGDPFVFQYDTGRILGMRVARATSVWGTPLSLAGYLGMILSLWHPLRKQLDAKFQGWKGHIFTLILWLCLFLTLTRSALVAVLASFAFSGILLSRKRSNIIWGLVILLSLIPLINLVAWIRMPSLLGGYGILPYDARISGWMSLLKTFSQSPLQQILLGRGLGSSSGMVQFENMEVLNSALVHSGAFTTDNFYLTALFEIGVVGLLIFCIVAFTYIRLAVKFHRDSEDPFLKSVYTGILFGLNFFLIRNIFLQGARTTLAGFYFWALIGLMLATKNISEFPVEAHAKS